MYDILQLNDMLVPELQDIAEQLAIPNYKKLEKQELVVKIVDKQAVEGADAGKDEKPKRKRIIKPADEAKPVAVKAEAKPSKKAEPAPEKKKAFRKAEPDEMEEEEEDLQPITSDQRDRKSVV